MCCILTEDALSARETQFQASAASLDADDAFSRLLLGCGVSWQMPRGSTVTNQGTRNGEELAGHDNIAGGRCAGESSSGRSSLEERQAPPPTP